METESDVASQSQPQESQPMDLIDEPVADESVVVMELVRCINNHYILRYISWN